MEWGAPRRKGNAWQRFAQPASFNHLTTMRQDEDDESSLTELSAGEEPKPPKMTTTAKRKKLVHSGLSQIAATRLTLKSDED